MVHENAEESIREDRHNYFYVSRQSDVLKRKQKGGGEYGGKERGRGEKNAVGKSWGWGNIKGLIRVRLCLVADSLS